MSTVYPGALDNVPEGVDLVTPINAVLINSMVDPINAIEETLGVDPQGNFATLNDRISTVVDVNGHSVIGIGTIDGVVFGLTSPPTGTLADITISGSFTGPFSVSATYGSFASLEDRLEAYEQDGHTTINDAVSAMDTASMLSDRLNMFASQIRLITGEGTWDTPPNTSLDSLGSQLTLVFAPDFVTSPRIAPWDGVTPAGDPTVGTGIDITMYRDASVTSSKVAPWDGTTAFNDLTGAGIANQHLKAGAVTSDKLAPGLVPVGATILFPIQTISSPIPVGWLECNGASISQTSFAELFAVTGTVFGPAAAGQFLLPNLTSGITNYIYIIRYE